MLRIIRTGDYEVLETIAKKISRFSECDCDILAEQLVKTDNPFIKEILAKNQSIDKKTLQILSQDEEPHISSLAENTLEEIEEDEDDEDENWEDDSL